MNLGLLAGALGLGAALGSLPGPVQFVLLTEATRGGARRGFAAMAGANGTMGLLLITLAAGLALAPPGPTVLRVLKVGGGVFLLLLSADAFRAAIRPGEADQGRTAGGNTPLLRGVLSVLLNPGVWILLATTASALFATAERAGGRPLALLAAITIVAGVASVDGTMVLFGHGARRYEERATRLLSPVLAVGLAAFGVVLLTQAATG
jgi:threonine/homoserine/homoserine lactone efflux protein